MGKKKRRKEVSTTSRTALPRESRSSKLEDYVLVPTLVESEHTLWKRNTMNELAGTYHVYNYVTKYFMPAELENLLKTKGERACNIFVFAYLTSSFFM